MGCEAHPRYKAKQRPRSNCLGCWTFYSETHPPEPEDEAATRCRQCGLVIEPAERCRSCGWGN